MEVKVSSKYQVVIPKEIRTRLNIRKGQKLEIFLNGNVVNLIPEKAIQDLKGFLRGMDTRGYREEDERT